MFTRGVGDGCARVGAGGLVGGADANISGAVATGIGGGFARKKLVQARREAAPAQVNLALPHEPKSQPLTTNTSTNKGLGSRFSESTSFVGALLLSRELQR